VPHAPAWFMRRAILVPPWCETRQKAVGTGLA